MSAAGCDNQVPGRQIANLDPDSFPLTRLVIRCLGSSHTHTATMLVVVCGVGCFHQGGGGAGSENQEGGGGGGASQNKALTRRWLGLGAGGLLPEPKGKIRVKCIAVGGQRQHDSTHFVCSSFPLQSA